MKRRSAWTCALVAILTGCAVRLSVAQDPSSSWSIGVLTGYRLSAIALRNPAARPAAVDLRASWAKSTLFPPVKGRRPGPGAEQSIKLLAVSPADGNFLVNLPGDARGNPGPLVLANARTGAAIRTFAVFDREAIADFLPHAANRIIVHWTDYVSQTGGARTSVFDTSTGQPILDVKRYAPAGHFFFFFGTSKLLYRNRDSAYRLLDTSSWDDGGPLAVNSAYSILDARDGTVLLEAMDRDRRISVWRASSASPVEIDAGPSAGSPASSYFLAGAGDRVVKWRPQSGTVGIYRAADGKLVSGSSVGKSVQSYAVHPLGNPVLFAVDSDIVILNVDTGRVQSRIPKAVPSPADAETFLFWIPPAKSGADR
jgi:hypothetical protein